MKRRRRHLLPLADPRFRPLAVSDIRKLPLADRRRLMKALAELEAGDSLWTYAPGSKPKPAASFLEKHENHRAEIRDALGRARLVIRGEIAVPPPPAPAAPGAPPRDAPAAAAAETAHR